MVGGRKKPLLPAREEGALCLPRGMAGEGTPAASILQPRSTACQPRLGPQALGSNKAPALP